MCNPLTVVLLLAATAMSAASPPDLGPAPPSPTGVHPELAEYIAQYARRHASVTSPDGGFVLALGLQGQRPGTDDFIPGFTHVEAIRVTATLYDLRRAGDPGQELPAEPPMIRLRHEIAGQERVVRLDTDRRQDWVGGAPRYGVPYETSWSADLAAIEPPLADGEWTLQAVLAPNALAPALGPHPERATPPASLVIGSVTLEEAIAANADVTRGPRTVELQIIDDDDPETPPAYLHNRTSRPIEFTAGVGEARSARPPYMSYPSYDAYKPNGWQPQPVGYCGVGMGPLVVPPGEKVAITLLSHIAPGQIIRYRIRYHFPDERLAEGAQRVYFEAVSAAIVQPERPQR